MGYGNIIFSGVVAALVSGCLTWLIAGWQFKMQCRRALFARLMAGRRMPLPDAFFDALNEIPATFADDKKVMDAWRVMLRHGQGDDNKNLIALLRESARAAKGDLSNISDTELMKPFGPGAGNRTSG